jgi:uncharacterized protein (TIGR02466 family)
MRDIIGLFPSPVCKTKLQPISSDIKDIIRKLEYVEGEDGNVNISRNQRLLDEPEFAELRKSIFKEFDFFTREVLRINRTVEFTLTNSWAVESKPGCVGKQHTHKNSIFSGVVYLETPHESGYIKFEELNDYRLFYQTFSLPFDDFNPLNSAQWTVKPEENVALFFPSNLTHSITKNESDNTRYSLAFNFFPQGTFGTGLYELTIGSVK